jgi:purine nucleosidase
VAKPIILDTDIGTDVDDCLALALILASPELNLLAVSTVYGDVELRARMVLKLLALRGAAGLPVAAGAARPLLGKRPVYWAGHEGRGLLAPEENGFRPASESVPSLIARLVMAQPGQITLVAIGPLTNVALALLVEPRLATNLASLVLMGGVVGGTYRQPTGSLRPRAQQAPLVDHPYSALALPWTEHNFRSDPEAAHVVLTSGAPIKIVPLDVTSQVRIGQADLSRIQAAGDPFHLAIADQLERYPRFAERGWTNLHDPLAVASTIDPTLVRFEALRAVVETGGEQAAGKLLVALAEPGSPATAEVALDVDVERSETFIVDRLVH